MPCEGFLAGNLSQEAILSSLTAAAPLCRLTELFEAVGFGEIGPRFTLQSPKLEGIVCLA